MRITKYLLMLLIVLANVRPIYTLQQHRKYAGQQSRSIKAFSNNELKGYLAGHGMGFAKAAELNHYPGPKHILELAAELDLTEKQKTKVKQAFNAMHEQALRLGTEYIDLEQQLDSLFKSGHADQNKLDDLIQQIAAVRGQLRLSHLSAHLKIKSVLSEKQVHKYDRLRGYNQDMSHEHKH